MTVKKKPFTYYAVLSLLATVIVILVLGKTLVGNVSDNLTKAHLRMLPETVHSIFDQHQDVTDWFLQPPGTTLPKSMSRLSNGLMKIPGVFRLKVWNTDGTILWSDHADLIGKNFSQNHHFQLAASGKVAYNNEGFVKSENVTEQKERIVVEVYLPVYDGNRIIGVLELYESDKELAALMVQSATTIWTSLALAGVVFYLLALAAYLLSQDVVTYLLKEGSGGINPSS